MLLRAQPQRARADFFQNFQERVYARVARRFFFVGASVANQRVRLPLEHVGAGVADSRDFASGHRMATKKDRSGGRMKNLQRGMHDAQLGAARIGNQRVRRGVLGDFWQQIERSANRQSNVDQVRAMQRRGEIAVMRFIDGPARFRLAHRLGAIPASDVHVRRIFFQRQRERSTDQPGAKNGDPLDEVGGRHESYDAQAAMVRPMAGAMMRSSRMSCSNCAGSSDCAPSDSAWSGSLCTSISSPSAPAATAARAIAATLSRRPVPCDGSAIIGKCESFLITGIAAISKVLRVYVSNVRMPRSQRATLKLPPANMYSALSKSSSMVADMPRLRSTGFLVSPRARKRK